ncbi:MAG: class I SAM-dependent methyltransferase [Candidatus Falkowbacteria bacterium]
MKTAIYAKYVQDLCKEFVKKQDKVFDCGCGDGSKTKILMQYSDNVIGGDLDNRVALEFKINFRKIMPTQYGDENDFDVVFSFDVIEHIKNDADFLVELMRITKPTGVIIVGTPNKNRLSNKVTALINGEIQYPRKLGFHYESGGDIIHVREYTKRDLLDLAEKLNIKNVVIRAGFLGLYTPFGAVGFKGLNQKRFAEYAQHLFLIIKKYAKK